MESFRCADLNLRSVTRSITLAVKMNVPMQVPYIVTPRDDVLTTAGSPSPSVLFVVLDNIVVSFIPALYISEIDMENYFMIELFQSFTKINKFQSAWPITYIE